MVFGISEHYSAECGIIGTIYALILIAQAGMRVDIVKSVGDFAWKLANVLRDPDRGNRTVEHTHCDVGLQHQMLLDTLAGKQVIETIIPAISRLRQTMPVRFDTMFSPSLLSELRLPSDSLICYDLRQSDLVFESLLLKYVRRF